MANDELMMDFQKLKENIRTFSNGEARIIDFDTKEPSIKVELYFKTGFHIKGRAFVFQFFPSTSYPSGDQKVVFLTPILHPAVDRGNIEVLGNRNGKVEDVVRDVYQQIKNPNFKAVLNPLFYEDLLIDNQNALREKFAEDVRMSFRVFEIFAEMNALGKNVVAP